MLIMGLDLSWKSAVCKDWLAFRYNNKSLALILSAAGAEQVHIEG